MEDLLGACTLQSEQREIIQLCTPDPRRLFLLTMNWFQGSIPEAIAKAKAQNALFVVVVYGKATGLGRLSSRRIIAFIRVISLVESSSQSGSEETNHDLFALLDGMASELAPPSVVNIRVENGTPVCAQFAQIYPVLIVPSIYFIER